MANFGEYTAAGSGSFKPLDIFNDEVSLADGAPTLISGSLGAYTASVTGNRLSFTGGGDGAPDGAVLRAGLAGGGTVDITINQVAGEAHCANVAELNAQVAKDSATAAASGGKSGLTAKLRPGTYEQLSNAYNGRFVWHAGTGFTISSEVTTNKARLQSPSLTQSVLNIGASSVTGSTYGKVTLDNLEIYGRSQTFEEAFGANFVSRYQDLASHGEFNVYLIEFGIGGNPFRDVTIQNCDFLGNKTDRPWDGTPGNPPVQYTQQIVGWQNRHHDGQDVTVTDCTFRYMDTCGTIACDDFSFTNNHVQFLRADMLRLGVVGGDVANPTNINITGNLLDQYWTTHRFHPDWLQAFGSAPAVDGVSFLGNMLIVNEQGVHCPPRDTSVNTGSAQAWAGPIDASGAIPAAEGKQFLLDLTGGDLSLTLADTAARPSGWTVNGAHSDADTVIALTGGTGSFVVGDTVRFDGAPIDNRHYEVMAWDGANLTIAGNLQAYSGGEAVDATTYHLNLQTFGSDGGATATITASGSDTIYDEDAGQTIANLTIGGGGRDWDAVRVRMDEANNRWLVGRNNSGFTAYQGVYQFNQAATYDDHMYAYNIAVIPGQAIRVIQGLADATNWDIANNTFVSPIIPDYIDEASSTAGIVQIDNASVTGPFNVTGNILGGAGSAAKYTDTGNLLIADQAGSGAAKPQAVFGGSGAAFNPGGTLSGSRADIINAVIADLRPTVETGQGALAALAANDKWDFVAGTVKRATPPLVIGLSSVAQSGGYVLSWTAPGYQDDYPITGYDVDIRVNGGGWTALAVNQPATTYSDAAQSVGNTVEYRVRAVNSQGSGPNMETASLKVIAPTIRGSNILTTTANSHTHNSVDTGAGAAGDLVAVTIGARTVSASGVTLDSVTIGGEALSIVAQAHGAHTLSAIAVVKDADGSIGGAEDIVLGFSSTGLQSAISVQRKSGIASAAPVATDSDMAGGDLSLTGLSDAFVVASFEGYDTAGQSLSFTSVSGVTINASQPGYEANGDRSSNASASAQDVSGDLTITAGNAGFEVEVFAAAAFE